MYRFRAFAGQQAGNCVLTGLSLIDRDRTAADTLYSLAMMGANLLGVVVFETLRNCLGTRKPAAGVAALPVATLTFFSDVFDAAGPSRWHATLVAAAFGAQYAATSAQLGVNATIMTGNVSKLGSWLGQLCFHGAGRSCDAYSEAVLNGCLVLSTILGAIGAGVVLQAREKPTWLFAPAAALQLVLLPMVDAASAPPPSSTSTARTTSSAAREADLEAVEPWAVDESDGCRRTRRAVELEVMRDVDVSSTDEL